MNMRLAGAFIAALLLAVTGAHAQQPQEPAPAAPAAAPAPADQPVALPAEALAYAAELEQHAPRKLLEWVRRRARELLRDEFNPEALRAESIARLFPRETPAAQEALRLLVGYEVYRRASARQESRAAVLRDIDREIQQLEDRQQALEATRGPGGMAGAPRRDSQIAAAMARIEELQIQRKLAVRSEEIERKRVDTVLRWLAGIHAGVKDTPAEILRAVLPPRS